MWLERDPGTTAKDLMERLSASDAERFSEAQFRPLHRRMEGWRGIMAKKLVYTAFGTADGDAANQRYRGESALVGAGTKG